MSVTVADLVVPAGPIDPEVVWPGMAESDRTVLLEGFLEAGVRKTVAMTDVSLRDRASVWWAAYRALDHQLDRIIGLPAAVDRTGEGGQNYIADQIKLLAAKRDAALAEFEELAEEALGEIAGAYRTIQSLR